MEKTIDHIRLAYNALEKVFVNKIYSDNAITEEDSNLSARITLGVLEKNVYLEYILSQIWKQEPNERVKIILKIGAYMLLFIDKIPDYAVVNETVNFVKNKYKESLKSKDSSEKKAFNQSTYKFANLILNTICRKEYKLPKKNVGSEINSVNLKQLLIILKHFFYSLLVYIAILLLNPQSPP